MTSRARPVWLVAALAACARPPIARPPIDRPASPVARVRSSAQAALAADLDRILADPRLAGGQAAVLVVDAATGRVLYERDADRRLIVASNQKLFTAAVALDVLGADHVFTTAVATTAPVRGPVLRGDLYLRGTGDPTMLAADYADLADQVARVGIHVVTGRLVADDTWFDDVRLGNDWSWDDEPFAFGAQVSALTVAPEAAFDAGSLRVEVRPGPEVGEPARVILTPATSHVAVVNQTTTGRPGSGDSIAVVRPHGGNRIAVTGSLAIDRIATARRVSVDDPTGYAADVFRRALAARGVRVLGPTATGPTPPEVRGLGEHRSAPLAAILAPFLKFSNNGYAEVLVKSIGRAAGGGGTWAAGLAAMRAALAGFGEHAETVASRDGSGLSRRNLAPPAEIAALLRAVQARPWFETWYQALPIAGDPDPMVGGTLRSRMAGTAAAGNVHAKTGTLGGASSLSGYVTDADGRRLIFSIVMNDYLSGKPSDLEDRIAVRLASYSEDPQVSPDVGVRRSGSPPPPDPGS